MKIIRPVALLGAAALLVAGCSGGGGSGGDGGEGAEATGPIDIWLSNNEQEVAWGTAVVDAWNAENPDEQVTAQEIPAGSSRSEEHTSELQSLMRISYAVFCL